MASPDLRGFIQSGLDILTTTVNSVTKKILAQLGDVHRESTDSDNAEVWQQVGFASRPAKPHPGKQAAQAVTIKAGDYDIVIATQDLRGLELYGQLDHGETCLYAPGEDGNAQGRVLLKKNGSINIFTKKGNAPNGAGMGIFVNPEDGSIAIAGPDGAAVILGSDSSVKVFNSGGSIQIGADGACKVTSTVKMSISAPSIVLGGSVAAPVVNGNDLMAFAALISTAIQASNAPLASAAAASFTTAATALITAMNATHRTTAD